MDPNKIQPEILDEGFGICQKNCVSFKKEDVKNGADQTKVLCGSLKDAVVHPRPLCVPWSQFVLKANKGLASSIVRFNERMKKARREMKVVFDKKAAEIRLMEKEGMEIRSRLKKAEKQVVEQYSEIFKLNEDVMVEDYLRQHLWGELKAIQEYRTAKGKYDKKLERVTGQRDELRDRIKTLDEMNSRLIQEDESKAKIIKKLEAVSGG